MPCIRAAGSSTITEATGRSGQHFEQVFFGAESSIGMRSGKLIQHVLEMGSNKPKRYLCSDCDACIRFWKQSWVGYDWRQELS